MPTISSTNRVTIPAETMRRAGLRAGDRVTVDVDGPGRITLRRLNRDPRAGFGVFDGLYGDRHLERIRADWA